MFRQNECYMGNFLSYDTTIRKLIPVMAKKKKPSLERIELEYIFRASPTILYQFFTTPSCLIRWYCDEVDITENKYSFSWDGYPEDAELLENVENERLRFKWDESEDDAYFEIRMGKSPVTSETILEITDFVEAHELEEQKMLWESQIKKLRQETGG